MSDENDLTDVSRYEWERLIRRVQMNPSTKLVALTLATYASRDGSSIYPGVARLAAVTCLSDKTVRVGLAWLRSVGMLYRTREGSHLGRRALADEHKLTRPVDLLTRLPMLDPEESPVMSTGDRPVDSAPEGSDHRYSVPGSPVLSSGSPVMSSRITGNGYRPPSHDQHTYQHTNQRDDQPWDVTTDRAGERFADVVSLNGRGGRR